MHFTRRSESPCYRSLTGRAPLRAGLVGAEQVSGEWRGAVGPPQQCSTATCTAAMPTSASSPRTADLNDTELQRPALTWQRHQHTADPDTYEGTGSLHVRYAVPTTQQAPPVLVRLTWRGTNEDGPKSQPPDVVSGGSPDATLPEPRPSGQGMRTVKRNRSVGSQVFFTSVSRSSVGASKAPRASAGMLSGRAVKL